MTKVQRVLLDILHQSTDHLTADQLYWQAKHFVPSVSVGTVYRNLNQFVLSGQIRRVSRPSAPDRFEANLVPHDHAVCRGCGRIIDVNIPELASFIASHCDLDIRSVNVMIDDLCPACAREGGSPPSSMPPA